MADLIRGAALTQLPELIAELGGDPDVLLARAGIPADAVGAHDRFIPFSAQSLILGMAAAEFGVPDFGLRLAARQDPDILGSVAIAARNAETVGEAVHAITQFAHIYSPAIASELVPDGHGQVAYVFHTVVRHLPFRDHSVEKALGVTLTTFRMIIDPRFRPSLVTFTHPPISEISFYRDYFGCAVKFETERNAILFSEELLLRPRFDTDPLVRDLAVHFMETIDRHDTFADVISEIVARSLAAGAATLEDIAEPLMLHPRAIQRRLADEAMTFEAIVDGVRKDMALQLLANPGVSLGALAHQLGYTEQSSLTRSCRRWFGMPPLAKRRELRREPPAPK